MQANNTDASDYYMPAEWEKHTGTWLQWPHDKPHRGYQLKLERMWLQMVDVLHQHETVHIIVPDERQADHVTHQLEYFGIGQDNVALYVIPTDDVWVRDNGPIFVVNRTGDLAITNWRFNGWGNRFEHQLDAQVPALLGQQLSLRVIEPPLVLEGGAVEVNGKGTFMATRTSVINPNRNPGKSQTEIESIVGGYLGVRSCSPLRQKLENRSRWCRYLCRGTASTAPAPSPSSGN